MKKHTIVIKHANGQHAGFLRIHGSQSLPASDCIITNWEPSTLHALQSAQSWVFEHRLNTATNEIHIEEALNTNDEP